MLRFNLILFIISFPFFLMGEIQKDFIFLDQNLENFFKINLSNGQVFRKKIKSENWEYYDKFNLEGNTSIARIKNYPNYYHFNSEEIYIFVNGNNLLFEINLNQKICKIIEIDKDFGLDISAKYFKWKNKLFKVGGNGFWNFHSNLYEFNFKIKKWKIIPTKGNIPVGFNNRTVTYSGGNELFLIETLNSKSKNINVFKLNLENFEWKLKGEITNQEVINQIKINPIFFEKSLGDYLIFSEKTRKKMYYINLKKNNLLVSNEIINDFDYISFLEIMDEKEVKALLGKNIENFTIDSFVKVFNLDTISNNTVNIGKIYKEKSKFNISNFVHWIIIFLLLLTIIIFKVLKKKNELKNTERLKIYLNILEKIIMQGNEITIQDFDEIIGLGNKSEDLKRNNRSKLVFEINKKIFEYYKIKNGLIRIKEKNDKRYVLYSVNEKLIDLILKRKI